jgi:hypothetical protein
LAVVEELADVTLHQQLLGLQWLMVVANGYNYNLSLPTSERLNRYLYHKKSLERLREFLYQGHTIFWPVFGCSTQIFHQLNPQN